MRDGVVRKTRRHPKVNACCAGRYRTGRRSKPSPRPCAAPPWPCARAPHLRLRHGRPNPRAPFPSDPEAIRISRTAEPHTHAPNARCISTCTGCPQPAPQTTISILLSRINEPYWEGSVSSCCFRFGPPPHTYVKLGSPPARAGELSLKKANLLQK